MNVIRLGTRGSRLALRQTQYIVSYIHTLFPDIQIQVKKIRTTGDASTEKPIHKIGNQAVFTGEIERELLNGGIDLAVHSLKDLPSALEPGLCLGAVLERENPCDVLLSHKGYTFNTLPKKAQLGTSSLRRISQILFHRSDICIQPIRGNVETRIRKMKSRNLDGIVLAYAGVKRLGCDDMITGVLPADLIMPAAGQGAIAVELREGDSDMLYAVKDLNDLKTQRETDAERSFLRRLQGGCQVPAGCLARTDSGRLTLSGVVAEPRGGTVYKDSVAGPANEALQLGTHLAEKLLQAGADRVISAVLRAASDTDSS